MTWVNELVKFGENFDFQKRRDHGYFFLWASRLWVGRQKLILGYISKVDVKIKVSGNNGLILNIISQLNYN